MPPCPARWAVLDKHKNPGPGGDHLPDKPVGGHKTGIGAGDRHRTTKEDTVLFEPCTDTKQPVVHPGTPTSISLVSEPFEADHGDDVFYPGKFRCGCVIDQKAV